MSETLVLTSGYQPLTVVPWQRAIKMFFLGKVEVVCEYDDRSIHSVRFTIRCPSVVRLTQQIRKPRSVKYSKAAVYARDGGACQYCGLRVSESDCTYDHVIPRAHGGRTSWDNIVACCRSCNQQKGGRTPNEAGMLLRQAPRQPHYTATIIASVSIGNRPPSWSDYLYS